MKMLERGPKLFCCQAVLVSLAVSGEVAIAKDPRLPSLVPSLQQQKRRFASPSLATQNVLDLEKILENDPCNAQALVALGIYYAQQGFVSSAQESFERASKCNPSFAKAPVELAKLLLARGETKKAMYVVDSALKRLPKDPTLLLVKGFLLYENHQYADAETIYASAEKANPQALGIGTALAQLRLLNGRFSEALALADADLKKDPNYFTANLAKGYALIGLKNAQLATGPLQKAYQVVPFQPNLAFNLAKCFQLSGKDAHALEPALVYLALSVGTQDQPEAKVLVAEILKKVPVEIVHKTVERVGEKLDKTLVGANLHFALGDIFDTLKQPQNAIEQYQLGLSLKPKFARGLFRLGLDFHQYLHRDQEALGYFERAAQLAPNDQEIADNLKKLKAELQSKGYKDNKDVIASFREWLSTFWR